MTTSLDRLAQRQRDLQQRSQALRTQLAGDVRATHASLAHGLSLARVATQAAGLGTALMALRRRAGRRWLTRGLRLLPLVWGLWRAVRAARTPSS